MLSSAAVNSCCCYCRTPSLSANPHAPDFLYGHLPHLQLYAAACCAWGLTYQGGLGAQAVHLCCGGRVWKEEKEVGCAMGKLHADCCDQEHNDPAGQCCCCC